MKKIILAALSILLLAGYSGGFTRAQVDTANTIFRPLADNTSGQWLTLTPQQATLEDHVEVAER